MKKRYPALLLAAAMCGNLLYAMPRDTSAAATTYEFESGVIYDAGENVSQSVTLTGASGGKAVSLLDAGDSVTLDFNAPADGRYTFVIRYSQPYDEAGKYQNILINSMDYPIV